jgi:hypothetical protein
MCSVFPGFAPSGLIEAFPSLTQGGAPRLRRCALPWAIMFRPFGAKRNAQDPMAGGGDRQDEHGVEMAPWSVDRVRFVEFHVTELTQFVSIK